VLDLRETVDGAAWPGEVLALRWSLFDHDDAVWVRERVYQGKFDTPKNGKPRDGVMSDGTVEDLRAWQGIAKSQTPRAFVFPSENPASPLDMGNLWRRRFGPQPEDYWPRVGNFSSASETNATPSKKAEVDAKVSADQRGHGLGVSLEVYTGAGDGDRTRDQQLGSSTAI
jgi:hypothetical protein